MYGPQFFEQIREGTKRSASIVVPLIITTLQPAPDSVIDVGCGEGWWGAEFENHGFSVKGIDRRVRDGVIDIEDHDLERDLPELGRFGLALCLEVAEHLSPGRAHSFVADLCGLSDLVVFSAAIPGQGGTNHLNERWPGYWVRLFAGEGYACSGALRWEIWEDDRIENWYRQNLLVFTRHPDRLPNVFDNPMAPPWPVIHPVLFDARVNHGT